MPVVAAPVAVLVVAIVALILLYAYSYMLHHTIVLPLRGYHDRFGVFPAIAASAEWVAGKIADGVEAAVVGVWNLVSGWAESAIQPVADFMFASVDTASDAWDSSIEATTALAHVVDDILTHQGPRIVGFVVDYVSGQIAAAEQRVVSIIHAEANGLRDFFNWLLVNQIEMVLSRVAELRQYVDETRGLLLTYVHAVGEWATQAIDNLSHYVDAELRAAEARLGGLIGGIEQSIRAELSKEAIWTQGLISDAVRNLTGIMARGDTQVAVTAAAATAVVATALEEYMDECGRDLCNSMGPIAKLLPELIEVLEEGVLFAILAYAIHDPKGAAEDACGVLGDMIDGANDIVRGL